MKILCKKVVYIIHAVSGDILGESFTEGSIYDVPIQNTDEYYAINNYKMLNLIAENKELQNDDWFCEHFVVIE